MVRSLNFNSAIAFAILLSGLLVSFTIVAYAQTTAGPSDAQVTAAGITFPVAELGNCISKDACRDYCNAPGNMPACIKFAKDRGLMNKDEADRAEKFRGNIERGEGPGGCRSPGECESFCRNINNIEACITFAKERGFKDKNVDEGEKVLSYIKSGGRMPGGCTSRDSCEKYCGDFSHAEECFNFAQKAGLTQVRGEVPGRAEGRFEGGIPPGQFQKFLEAVKKGETPGGCKSKDECETYCGGGAHFEECVAFGEKTGFIERDQAEKIRKSGGKGPGSCASPESCRAYCNEPTHQEECFRFAEENGFIGKEELKHAKEGFVRLRQGLEQAPPEVAECLKSVLGPDIIGSIESGKLTPGPEIGERVRGCFEKFGHRGDSNEAFKNAPPQVLACLKEKLGDAYDKVTSGQVQPTPEMGDTFRVCFQQFEIQRGGQLGEPRGGSPGGPGRSGPPPIQGFLQSAPAEVAGCLKEKLGGDFEKIKSGELQPGPEIKEKLQSCFQEFRPPEHRFNPERKEFEKFEGGERPEGLQRPEGFEKPEGFDKFRSVSPQPAQPFPTQPFPIPPVQLQPFPIPAIPTPFTGEKPAGTVCIQVITPAKDPVTGVCKQFPTPCDVPVGWQRGCFDNPTIKPESLTPPTTDTAPIQPSSTTPPSSGLAPVNLFGNILQGFGALLNR
ncbi:MAG: hypothetical protein HYW37_02130 [Candidatus Colwellbacteria bacterium]|nr:hypothetical protein [Candidatus Colwellbacteria bacterium]